MYEVGQVLDLQTTSECAPDGDATASGQTIKVRIHSMPAEFTCSAVLVVDIISHPATLPLPSRAFLKLSDRRCLSEDNRGWIALEPPPYPRVWTPEIEAQVLQLSRTGEAQRFLDYAAAIEDPKYAYLYRGYMRSLKIDDPDFDDADLGIALVGYEETLRGLKPLGEIGIWLSMKADYKHEVEVLHELREYQGSRIPKLFARVEYAFGEETQDNELGKSPELFKAYGLLMEHIDGFQLGDIEKHTDRSEWQGIVDRAVQTTGEILNTSRVVNFDVKPRNMLVVRDDAAEGGYRLVMIDFGQAELRSNEETDQAWGERKFNADEEGSIWYRMAFLEDNDDFKLDVVDPGTWNAFGPPGFDPVDRSTISKRRERAFANMTRW